MNYEHKELTMTIKFQIIAIYSILFCTTVFAADPITLQNIAALASNEYNTNTLAVTTINSSGLDASGLYHGNSGIALGMWLSGAGGTSPSGRVGPAWIKYTFNSTYSLDTLWVWNFNQVTLSNRGLQQVYIDYSVDGTNWTLLKNGSSDTWTIAQATGLPNYAHNTTINLGSINTKYVTITASQTNGNWGSADSYGLSEVRFFGSPLPYGFTVNPMADLNYYTTETQGYIAMQPYALSPGVLTLGLEYNGQTITSPATVTPGQWNFVPFSLSSLPLGTSTLTYRFYVNGTQYDSGNLAVVKLSPQPYAVKIDNPTKTLVVNNRPFLPFGYYIFWQAAWGGTNRSQTLEECVDNGFSFICPYWSEARLHTANEKAAIGAFLDRCAALGLKVNFALNQTTTLPDADMINVITDEVTTFRNHPAIISWYIADEPEGQGQSPAKILTAYNTVKQLDPYRPVAVVFMGGTNFTPYLNGLDIVMMDRYPVPVLPASSITQHLDNAIAMANGRPVWMVPQAFGGSESTVSLREPTAGEEQIMAYLSITHGAGGVQFFIRSEPSRVPKSPLAWAAIEKAAMEISLLTPTLLSTETAPPITFSPATVEGKAYLKDGMLTVIAINKNNQPSILTIQISGCSFSGDANVPFEYRQVQVNSGLINDTIDGYGVRVYQIPVGPMPTESVNIDSKNIAYNPSWETMVNPGTPENCAFTLGSDLGATAMLDSMEVYHGQYSLRLTTPTQNQGITINPYVITDQIGIQHTFSIWAKSDRDGTQFIITINGAGTQMFWLTQQWQQYQITWVPIQTHTDINLSYYGPGVAWFDVMQVIPVSSILGDFDGNGTVNMVDLADLATQWLNSCVGPDWCNGTDLNVSGNIDFEDYTKLAESWMIN
jgi:hypothetical protein